jgi:Ser/Thr protein kinase RdoA (MazF antagonist)
MTHFPVTSSNISALHLADFLQEKYTLSKAATCKIIKAGVNHTYLVTDDVSQYVFRLYSFNWRTQTEIAAEIKLLQLLQENGIAVSYSIGDNNGQYIQTLAAPEGDRFGVLFSFAPGEKLHIVSEETHFETGVLVAKLHQVTHNLQLDRVTYTPQVLLIDPMAELQKFLPEHTEEMQFMRSAQSALLNVLAQADKSQLRMGTVHLDIWFDNLNITHKNTITLFDFDFCGYGWLCLDVAYYILQLHNIERYEAKDYLPKVNSFLDGYESVLKLTAEERRLIPALGVSLYYFYLGVQCQRYENWSNTFLSENYLKRFINGLVKRYYDLYLPAIGSN